VLPAAGPGQAIGLFGGSFNPPHAGHVHVSETALRRLKLDFVWWLVTPGNPLKDANELAPLANRMSAARDLLTDPRIKVTSIETDIGLNRTIDTLHWLIRRRPEARFVWIMGADNLASFHRWHGWREIAQLVPMAIIDRPGAGLQSRAGRAAQALSSSRIDEADAALLPRLAPPAWVFLHGPHAHHSSSVLRQSTPSMME
jgi:nicotinate-nucleotide adenylyltransferase